MEMKSKSRRSKKVTRHPKQVLVVNFERPRYRATPYAFPERRYGGCGILTVPPAPYDGPPTMQFEALVGRERVRFNVTRMERAPSGHTHGSFRIDELTVDRRGNERIVTVGYNCSWPDADVCRRAAALHRQS
jgi:hypothetical protein